MNRILLTLILALVAFFGGRAVYRAMASDETKIGWVLAAEVAAFEAASVLNLTPHFAADFRDDTTGIGLQTLRGAVVWAWQNELDAEGHFTWRLALPEGAGEVAVDGDSATATFPLQLFRGIGDEAKLVWGLRVTAKLERKDGSWWIVQSSHGTTEGTAPKSPLK
jgi:hypothetical protein